MNRGRPYRLVASLSVIGVWGGIALLDAGQLVADGLDWTFALRRCALEWSLWAALWPLVRLLARGFRLGGERTAASLPIHMILSGVLAALHLALYAALDRATGSPSAGASAWDIFRAAVLRRWFLGVMTYFAMVAVATVLEYRDRLRERERSESQLQARLTEARLDLLKMQVHPHFLFNTLNAVSALIHRDPDGAERTIALLSDLLRKSLDHDAAEEVPLARELELLEPYLEIERTRFPDRLSIALEIDPDAREALVPSFVLQPLVENAIRHGIAPRAAPGRVDICARRQNGTLELEVRDDGRGPGEAGQRLDGVGLGATRARLRALYGNGQELRIEAPPGGGTRVAIAIPFRPKQKAHGD